MIVDSQALTTIGVGAQKVQTEVGDSTLKIPNLILPTLSIIEPTTIFPNTNVPQTGSFVQGYFISRNNAAGGTLTIITLGKGLWSLTIGYGLKTTFAAAIPHNTNSNFVQIVSPPGGVSNTLLSLHPIQTGYTRADRVLRLLLRENALIEVGVHVTGVADFLDAAVEICAEKLL